MKQKDLFFLLVSSTLLAVIWIVFTILHTSFTSTISSTVNKQIIPIDGSFDSKTMQSLQKRQQITPQYVFEGTNSVTNTPTPTLIPVALLSPISIPTGASQSAQKGATPTP